MDGSMPPRDLIARVTLEELLGWRERAMHLASEARDAHLVTLDKIREAATAGHRASASHAPFCHLGDYVRDHHGNPDAFADKVRRDLDASVWRHLLKVTGIEGLMDNKAVKKFEAQLTSNPPEVTAETVRATFQQFKRDAHIIFRRGLIEAFVDLDRTYRSHDGFKIGNRMVRSYAMSGSGSIHDTIPVLRDVDRIMHVLDGVKVGEGWISTLVTTLDGATRSMFWTIEPGSIDTEYWHVKWFKNRNMHLYPKRKDLVRRANRLIAEHFGDALGAGADVAGARRYTRARPHHSDVEDFYPTPPSVAARMVAAARLQPGQDVLEPSAGDGAIVAALLACGVVPDAVEIDPGRAETLRDMLPPGAVVQMDFLKMDPEPEYQAVLLNPPFGSGAGVQHVFHALRFLEPGGVLVAVLGSGIEYREDGPTRELRHLIKEWGGKVERLPAGSFRHAGTNVETVLVVIDKPSTTLPALAAPEGVAAVRA